MSNPPNNPPSSEPPPPNDPKSPWAYSTGPQGSPGYYTPPTPKPVAASSSPVPPSAGPTLPASAASIPPAPRPAGTPNPPPPAIKSASSAPPPPPAPVGDDKPSDASLASVIDTIEAIIIALIIALTFRAFIVEAFVIPTGSMAPTLLGAHFKIICPQCGYEFDRDASLRFQAVLKDGQYFLPPAPDDHAELRSNSLVPCDTLPIYCPNCRFPIAANELPQYLATPTVIQGNNKGPISFVWANNGDRILVLKYLYSIMEPSRWDVIVFKEPQGAKDNYIKRLIGLPNETIEIINGDIYVLPPGDKDPAQQTIARKPDYVQQNVWQLVYDNDFHPIDEGKPRPQPDAHAGKDDTRKVARETKPWTNPWQPKTPGWTTQTVFAYAGQGPSGMQFNLRPDNAREIPYTLNTLGYNDDLYIDEEVGQEFAPRSIVGDLRLEALWTPSTADSAGITCDLGRPNNCFQVSWKGHALELRKFDVALNAFRAIDPKSEGPVPLIEDVPPPEPGHSYRIALNNVDHAIAFTIDGKKVISYEPQWTRAQAIDDAQKFPAEWSAKDLFLNPSIAARANTMIDINVDGPCSISHLKLFRDLFYTQVLPNHGTIYPGTATRDNPLKLGDNEFFALGDNSRRSSDGRLWEKSNAALGDLALKPGVVPRRYLLGKAFFVYWPAGFRPTDNQSIPLLRDFPIVPNTGDMRIIR